MSTPRRMKLTEAPPHLAFRLGREVCRGHHHRRAEGDGRHDRVLRGMGVREHGVEDHGPGFPERPEGPDETRDVEVAAYAVEPNDWNLPVAEFLLELVRHDPDHHRFEPLPVEVVQKVEQVAFDAAEGIALDVVDDSDRVLQVGFRRTGQGGEHFLGHRGGLVR